MLRIFMSSTHTGAVFQAIQAEKSKKNGDSDVLILDYPAMKESLIQLIKDSACIHKWEQIIDFSKSIPDEVNRKPTIKKRIIRKLKILPLVRNVYRLLLKRFLEKQRYEHILKLKKSLSAYPERPVQLNVLTKTGLNDCLFEVFPDAEINYFEHGIGDYMYYSTGKLKQGNFYCLFNNEFSDYLKSTNNLLSQTIRGYLDSIDFKNGIAKLITAGIIAPNDLVKKLAGEKIVFVLLENVEMYNVPAVFWTDYIELCVGRIENPRQYVFVIKPHHMQSFDAIKITEDYFKAKELNYVLLTDEHFMHIGAEIMFYFFYPNTKYVFSLFSSSIYYFTKLYLTGETKYYHGYKLFEQYTKNSPKQFVDIYKGLEPVITKVLAKDCFEI